jgi:hypothetical protein
MYVRAFDGLDWSNWVSASLTTANNVAPNIMGGSVSINVNGWRPTSFRYSDSNDHAAVRYEFRDLGTDANSAYFWTPANAHHAAGTTFSVAASEIANVWIRGGAVAGGTEFMEVRAFDGLAWSAWASMWVSTVANRAPTVSAGNHTIFNNQWAQVSSWITADDLDSFDAITRYEFWDQGTASGSGYFYSNSNAHHAAGSGASFIVEAADLGSVWVRGGSAAGSETLQVRAFDGTTWGNWTSFTLTTQMNALPAVSVPNMAVGIGGSVSINYTYADANGHAPTQFELWDGGTAASSAYFYNGTTGARYGADQSIVV